MIHWTCTECGLLIACRVRRMHPLPTARRIALTPAFHDVLCLVAPSPPASFARSCSTIPPPTATASRASGQVRPCDANASLDTHRTQLGLLAGMLVPRACTTDQSVMRALTLELSACLLPSSAFEDMLKAGKTRSIAVSNFSPSQLDCLINVLAPSPTVPWLPAWEMAWPIKLICLQFIVTAVRAGQNDATNGQSTAVQRPQLRLHAIPSARHPLT